MSWVSVRSTHSTSTPTSRSEVMAQAIRPWVCDTLNPTVRGPGGATSSGRPCSLVTNRHCRGIAAQKARQLQPRQRPADDEALLVGLEMEPRFARHFLGIQQPSIAVQPCPHRRVILADGEHVDDTLRVGIDHGMASTPSLSYGVGALAVRDPVQCDGGDGPWCPTIGAVARSGPLLWRGAEAPGQQRPHSKPLLVPRAVDRGAPQSVWRDGDRTGNGLRGLPAPE